ncbi:hypothetical protein AB1Y20_006737 [Prymnesium parvum]|uniref:Uncharacterized protein n=1 Tax=Prymnesium parvum TaxID=97485 RepID=A0AB34J1J2_PRYPA
MRVLLLYEAGASFEKWHEAISARLVVEKALQQYRCSARKAALRCWASMTDALQEAVPKLFRALQLENHARGPAFTGEHGDVRTPVHILAYLEQLKNAATLSLACKRWVRAAAKRKLDGYESRRASNAIQRSAVSQWARAARHTEAIVQRLLHAEKTGQRHSMLFSLRVWHKVSAARQMVHISARRISFASRRVAFDELSEAASNRAYLATCTKRAIEHARRTTQAAALSRWRWDNVEDIMLHFIGGHMSLLALPLAFRRTRARHSCHIHVPTLAAQSGRAILIAAVIQDVENSRQSNADCR